MGDLLAGKSVVFFDLDDTLVPDVECIRDAVRAVARSVGAEDEAFLAEVLAVAHDLWYGHEPQWFALGGLGRSEGLWSNTPGTCSWATELERWIPEYRHAVWSRVLGNRASDDRIAEVAERYRTERVARFAVLDDALPLLEHLAGSYRMGVITNGPADLQRAKLDATGLAAFFETVVVSADVGCGKPDPRIFENVLSALHVQPADAVMIGNTLDTDVAGAIAAGVDAIWVNRDGDEPSDQAVAVVTTLTDLVAG